MRRKKEQSLLKTASTFETTRVFRWQSCTPSEYTLADTERGETLLFHRVPRQRSSDLDTEGENILRSAAQHRG